MKHKIYTNVQIPLTIWDMHGTFLTFKQLEDHIAEVKSQIPTEFVDSALWYFDASAFNDGYDDYYTGHLNVTLSYNRPQTKEEEEILLKQQQNFKDNRKKEIEMSIENLKKQLENLK